MGCGSVKQGTHWQLGKTGNFLKMFIAVNNIARQQEIDPIAIGFKQRVLETMKKQIKKKLSKQHETPR